MFRVISLPPFRAAASPVDKHWDFSPTGILGQFGKYFSAITPSARDSFAPRDFLYYDEQRGGAVWMYALSEDIDEGGNEIIDFDGGIYLTYTFRDGDDKMRNQMHDEAMKYIEDSGLYALDTRPNHYGMGHIITPPEVIAAQGWAQMEAFIPIKLKNRSTCHEE